MQKPRWFFMVRVSARCSTGIGDLVSSFGSSVSDGRSSHIGSRKLGYDMSGVNVSCSCSIG